MCKKLLLNKSAHKYKHEKRGQNKGWGWGGPKNERSLNAQRYARTLDLGRDLS